MYLGVRSILKSLFGFCEMSVWGALTRMFKWRSFVEGVKIEMIILVMM
jgi:hypothetical protein